MDQKTIDVTTGADTTVASLFENSQGVAAVPTADSASTTALTVVQPVTLTAITPAQLLPADNLPAGVLSEIEKRAAAISFDSSVGLLTYGKANQDEIDHALDELLAGVRTQDAGIIGDVLSELKTGISELELEEIKKELDMMGSKEFSWRAAMRKLPGLGHAFSHVEQFCERKEQIVAKINGIRAKVEGRMVTISDYQTRLTLLAQKSVSYTQQLAIDIMAGQRKLAATQVEFDARREALRGKNDAMEAGALRELAARLVQFDTRLIAMKTAFTDVAVVGRLQNLMTQEAGNTEISNLMDVVMFNLPNLKRIVLGAAAEIAIKRAQMDGQSINEAEKKATEASLVLLRDVYKTAKQTQGQALTHVELLSHVTDELIKTLGEGEEIDKQTAAARQQAEQLLIGIKNKTTAATAGIK